MKLKIVLFCLLSILSFKEVNAQCNIDDFNALRSLFISTDGPGWSNNTGWDLVGNNIAPPLGCDLSTMNGIFLDGNGRVSQIFLFANQMDGTLPAALGDLAALTQLEITDNPQLTGPIPPELGDIPGLKVIRMSNNALTGNIPIELGNLQAMTTLDLSQNQLTGPIPNELTNLPVLKSLFLNENQLTGDIPNGFGNIATLQNLSLYFNQLTGPIPADLGNSNLNNLLVHQNQLSGCYDSALANLCGQLYNSINVLISDGNNFDASWTDFCNTGAGQCAVAATDDDWSGAGTGNMYTTYLTDNVGIGTATPTKKLDVEGDVRVGGNSICLGSDNGFNFFRSNAGSSQFLHYGTAQYSFRAIDYAAISFWTNSTARMQVTKDGDLKLFTGEAYKLGSATWAPLSDRRLKKNIQTYKGGLDELMQINPVTFEYNEKVTDNSKEYVGIIAQEVKEVAPYMIKDITLTDKNGEEIEGEDYLAVNPNAFIYMLINSTKEQQNTIESQDKTIVKQKDALDKQAETIYNQAQMIDELEEKMETIKAMLQSDDKN